MKLKFLFLMLLMSQFTIAQIQEEWLIGNNKVDFTTDPPTVSFMQVPVYSFSSLKVNNQNKSLVVDFDYNTISGFDVKFLNHSNFGEISIVNTSFSLHQNQRNYFLLTFPNQVDFLSVIKRHDIPPSGTVQLWHSEHSSYKYDSIFENFSYYQGIDDLRTVGYSEKISALGYGKDIAPLNSNTPTDYLAEIAYENHNYNGTGEFILTPYLLESTGIKNIGNINNSFSLPVSELTNYLNYYSVNGYPNSMENTPYMVAKFSYDLSKFGLLIVANTYLNIGTNDSDRSNDRSWLIIFDFDKESGQFSDMKMYKNYGETPIGWSVWRDFEFSKSGDLLYVAVQKSSKGIIKHSTTLDVRNLSTGGLRSVDIGLSGYYSKLHRDPHMNLIAFYGIADNGGAGKFVKITSENDFSNADTELYFSLEYLDTQNKIVRGDFILPQYFPKVVSPQITTLSNTAYSETKVYPNPISDRLFIETSDVPESIRIYDSKSTLIKDLNGFTTNKNIIEMSTEKTGNYQLIIHMKNGNTESHSIMKK